MNSLPLSGAAAFRARRATVHLREPAHQREPDAQAAMGAVQAALALHEEVEDARQQVLGHAYAVVGDAQHGFAALRATRHADACPAAACT